jgi:TolB-like protein/DNA-binding winged helix-turn-helix (wHTH) protein/Flp pilus assembly protein TadD
VDRSRGSDGDRAQFGIFELDRRTLELRKNGSKIRIEGQPLRVLAILLERPGELVTRDQLHQALWKQDTFVSFEQGINNCIRRLREILGDSAQTPHFIETLPRRGYRFIYPVQTPVVTASPLARPRRLPLLALATFGVIVLLGALAATVPLLRHGAARDSTLHSIAVLPLENLTGSADQQYLVDGFHDELIATLAHIRSLRVPPRNTVLRYPSRPGSLQAIARELGVESVMEGSVQHRGTHYVITALLIDPRSDRLIWSSTFERDERQLSTLSSQITLTLAREAGLQLEPAEEARLRRSRGVDPEAFKVFFKANYFRAKRTPQTLDAALDFYRQALDIDPTYAPAWNGIGECYDALGRSQMLPPHEAWPKATAAIEKALELDPSLADAHKTLGLIKVTYDRDWDGAEQEAAIAKSLDPNWAGDSFTPIMRGRFDEGIKIARAAIDRNPLMARAGQVLGWAYFQAGRYDDSIEQLQKTIQLDPRNPYAYEVLGWDYVKKGMCSEAIAACEKGRSLEQRQTDGSRRPLEFRCAWVYASCGRRSEALHALEENDRLRDKKWINPGAGAFIYDALGDQDRAAELMWKSYNAGVPIPEYYVCRMCTDALRAHPRFAELRRRIAPPEARNALTGPLATR